VPELARTCVANAARLELDERIEGGVRVETDPEAVLQILSNLVENACKYARAENDADSTVRLRSQVVDGRLALDVCDDGPGVPAAVARSIFEPFERGGRDSSDPARGVGLGLALSRALAAELGGTLTLVPAERGATFRLSLPLAG
jgi:signal transduction histidine kinase